MYLTFKFIEIFQSGFSRFGTDKPKNISMCLNSRSFDLNGLFISTQSYAPRM